jgi:hypothetical protein
LPLLRVKVAALNGAFWNAMCAWDATRRCMGWAPLFAWGCGSGGPSFMIFTFVYRLPKWSFSGK